MSNEYTKLYEDTTNGLYISNKYLDEHKKLVERVRIREIIPSDEDTEISDTETDTPPLYKCLIITTKAQTIPKHDAIINKFNKLYGTSEKGSNGSSGGYFTHGETKYNINELPLLKELYITDIKEFKILRVKCFLSFEDTEEKQDDITEEKHDDINCVKNNFIHARNNDQSITIPSHIDFNKFMDEPYILDRFYYKNKCKVINNEYNEGDILYLHDEKSGVYQDLYQVIKTTKLKVVIQPLIPILTATHKDINGSYTTYLYKYRLNNIDTSKKWRYFNKTTFSEKVILNDYVYMNFYV